MLYVTYLRINDVASQDTSALKRNSVLIAVRMFSVAQWSPQNVHLTGVWAVAADEAQGFHFAEEHLSLITEARKWADLWNWQIVLQSLPGSQLYKSDLDDLLEINVQAVVFIAGPCVKLKVYALCWCNKI